MSSLSPSRSIRVRLGVIFALFSAAVAMVLTGLLGQLGRRDSEEQMRFQLSHSAAELAKSIDLGLFERFGELEILSRMLLVDGQLGGDSQRELLEGFQDVNLRYTWIAIVDRDGIVRVGSDRMREGENLGSTEFFQRALQRPFVGEIRDSGVVRPDGRRVWDLEMAIPFTGPDEEIIGVVAATVSWDWLNGRYEVLSSTLQEVRRVEVLVLDRGGRIILAPGDSGLESQRFSLQELTDPDRLEQQYIFGSAVCKGLRNFAGVGWTVVLRQPEEYAFGPVRRLQGQLFLAGIAGALIAGVAGWWIAGIFIKPVTQLARVSRELAGGTGGSSALPRAGDDEIGVLTGSLRTLLETRERQANELRQTFRQFTTTFETAAVGIALVSLEGRWLRVNQKLADILGYSREELVNLSFADVTFPEDLPQDVAHVQRLIRGEALTYTLEKRYIRKTGDIIWVNLTAALSKDESGESEYFVYVVEDITARREAQEALRESEERFREVADQAPVLIWTSDEQKRCTFVNRPWLEFTGLTMEQVLGDGWQTVAHPDDAGILSQFNSAFDQRQPFQGEYRLRRRDGEYRWVQNRGLPLFRGSTFVGYVGSSLDCTETRRAADDQRAAREAAESASRAKDEFLAALSHELRTPLNPVLLLASDNEKNAELPEEVREDFMAIRKSIALEARLIDDLLDLTRITRGKLQLNAEPVDAHSVLHQALNLVHSELEAKQIVITLDLSSPEHRIVADAVRLQQVFWNVILNAVKFTPAGGTISIRTRPGAARSLHIEITDNGMGIAPEEMPRIFETFGQGVHSHSPHRFGGLGLGLAIAKLLVEQQSGRIWAESAGSGRGATFLIELPLAQSQSGGEPAARADTPARDVGSRKILLVEDHDATRLTMTRLLLHRGHEVQAAATVATARALAAATEFDLVISDLGLPDGSGHDLMAELNRQYGLMGIALSGYGMDDDVQRSSAVGFHCHLTKPVDIGALEEALASAVGGG